MGREGSGGFPLVNMGLNLSFEQIPQCLAEELMFVGLNHCRTIPPGFFGSPFQQVPLHCATVTEELVHVERDGARRTLILDSPHNRNALSSQLLDELAEALLDATADRSVRVILLTGTGTVFCSGADLSERHAAVTSRMPEILTLITTAPVPVIARVNGHTRAGGLGLIAASDLAVAPTHATFAFSEVRVGVAPAMILVPARDIMQRRFMSRTMLAGEGFGAAEAATAGLLTACVEDENALDPWVDTIVESILKSAPGAVAATKTLLSELTHLDWNEALSIAQERSRALFAGDEAAEGMEAFLNKRRPSWDVTAP
jgi:methylglutaconyl-CoA hydratase